jgi:type III secretion system chaperone SycN
MNHPIPGLGDTLDEFGRQMGLPAWQLNDRGVAQLELQAGGLLGVEPAGGGRAELLVYLGRPLGFGGDTLLRRALARAHHGSALPMPVQVAVRGDGPDALLLVLLRVPEREFSVQALGRAVEYLGRWWDGAQHG